MRLLDWLIPILTIIGLYWFSSSFFLAKRSLPHSSSCDEAHSLLTEVLKLEPSEISSILGEDYDDATGSLRNGCWLPRKVDSVVILVVDAMRFDFSQYSLPKSIGSRIAKRQTTSSQLLQFVADPPTVTMQRLKGLTTGSLPTFADISGNMGGSTMDEDSWVQQLKNTDFKHRGLKYPSKLGFVGDDTWVDLFPVLFDESYPFPSFNTRDLDTVDNGCLKELPNLMKHVRRKNSHSPQDLELVISHFLGVDHVGHTYGPFNEHMDAKYRQMDEALSTTLDLLDEEDQEEEEGSKSCHLALIFGDHGMTNDGNHGGGTDEEINAALFVHFSKGCHLDDKDRTMPLEKAAEIMGSTYVQDKFQSMNQIDLVPTISILLGLPIPYQNLGGIVPSLLASHDVRETAAALALNAAQVWRYFTIYSQTANRLPNLPELEEQLKDAVSTYREALRHNEDGRDSNAFYTACGLFKLFLVEASELGHRVWTRFDTVGMAGGGLILAFVVLATLLPLLLLSKSFLAAQKQQIRNSRGLLENILTLIYVVFHCGMLSFSNSYIEAEQRIVMFMMTTLGGVIFVRLNSTVAGGNARILPYVPLLLPILSRVTEVFVSGHGLDPSIRLHAAHSQWLFLPSLMSLLAIRTQVFEKIDRHHLANAGSVSGSSILHAGIDGLSLVLLAFSWIEKRNSDPDRNGYVAARGVIGLLIVSMGLSIFNAFSSSSREQPSDKAPEKASLTSVHTSISKAVSLISRLLIAIMLVTGPATSCTVLIACLQGWMLFNLAGATGFYQVSVPVQAFLWRLVVRHVFFATNHGCAFNMLQYSAAFVATIEFDFVFAGSQLFMNTFGWEIVGISAVCLTAFANKKPSLWKWYCFYQILEGFLNCISVSILRRHLMVWATYAPRFIFSAIFLVLNSMGQLIYIFLVPAAS
mmetsp:Transcript_45617/g.110519  ORF Transcript_45617/g.110519 Transcript_45617/m.110519 type:complete len:921 (+) Transcript_45617:260-3022(+)